MKHKADTASDKFAERARRKAEKRYTKKVEIAASTLDTLKRLGYANTTLRDITAESGLPLSSLSYYFIDKAELITFCVRLFKTEFIEKLNLAIAESDTPEAVLNKVANTLSDSIIKDSATHRLWYDIRTQAMFDSAFTEIVDEIETKLIKILTDIAEATGNRDTSRIALSYAMIDGVFHHLIQHTEKTELSKDQLNSYFTDTLSKIFW